MADRGRGSRMSKEWSNTLAVSQGFTTNSTALLGFLSVNVPATVLRILGEYTLGPTAASTAADRACITVGIGVVSSDAVELGSTAMPDPEDEPNFPWLYWASHPFHYVDSSLESGLQRMHRRSFDVRSMRKMKPRESLAVVAQYTDINGVPAMRIESGPFRVLIATG